MNICKDKQSYEISNTFKFLDGKFNSDVTEIILCTIKLYMYVKVLCSFNFFFGLIILAIYDMLITYILNKFFHLQKLRTNDLFILGFSKVERANMICCFFFEKNFNPLAIKKLLINNGIKKNEKLRKKIVRKFGIYFWKDVDLQMAETTIKIIDNKFSDKDGVLHYVSTELDNHIDIINCLPYEFQIIPYNNKEGGAIIVKLDHTLSDGLGTVSLSITLSDNFDETFMPDVMKKMKIPFHRELGSFLLNILFFPYYSSKLLLNGLLNKIEKSPFRRTCKSTGSTSFAFTKNFDFKPLHKINKKLKITFNDLMLAIISASINKYAKSDEIGRKYSYDKLIVAIPIGTKNIPNSAAEVQLENDILGAITILKRIDDSLKQYELIAKETKNTIKNHYNTSASRYLFSLLNQFLPYSIHKRMAEYVGNTVDLGVSNVPGPTRQISYCNSKVDDIIPFMSISFGKAFIIISTYNNKVRIVTCADAGLDLNVVLLTNIIEEEINYVINSEKI